MRKPILSLLVAATMPLAGPAVADDAPPQEKVDAAPDSAAVMGDLTPPQKPSGVDEFTALQTPPPGSPEDQALWKRGNAAGITATYERWRTLDLRVKLRQHAILTRLDEMAKKASADKQKSLTDLAARIRAAESFAGNLRDARWPVDTTRVCGYPVLHFGSAMGSANTPKLQANLAVLRIKLQECCDKAEGASGELKRANDTLDMLMKQAMEILDAAGPWRQPRSAKMAPAAGSAPAASPAPAAKAP